jgi:hypothetical protein
MILMAKGVNNIITGGGRGLGGHQSFLISDARQRRPIRDTGYSSRSISYTRSVFGEMTKRFSFGRCLA